ncbi:MAG: leucine-rich repeat domain-containing protein [Clostridia bacterium]|nr:leucine-rich repeat domain-containing protein [Clostridia bacterium]
MAETSGDYEYSLNDDGTVTIIKYSGDTAELVLPTELDGHPVTAIGSEAFKECDDLVQVTIPGSVCIVGVSEFGAGRLNRDMAMGEGAFTRCDLLKSVILEEGVNEIEAYAFSGCKCLEEVVIPESVTRIGSGAFAHCGALTEIILPSSLTSIGNLAFYNCGGLTQIIIPEGVTDIAYEAFSCCENLTSVVLPNSLTSIGEAAFSKCKSLTQITIPEGVTSIGRSAFSDCGKLTGVTLPENVTEIGENAFPNREDFILTIAHNSDLAQYCRRNHILYTYPDTPGEVFSAVEGTSGDYSYEVFEDGALTITRYHGQAKTVEIPAELEGYPVVAIGDNAFGFNASGATKSQLLVSKITIPESVTEIGEKAFCNRYGLTSVTILPSVTAIGQDAFEGCSKLTLTVSKGSVAEQYAIDNNIPYTYAD